MEKRIDLELRGRKPEEVTDLNLDNCRSAQIVGLSDRFTMLETLSLINVGLINLKGFPSLPSLRRLELSDNKLSDGLDPIAGCPNITHINLSGNSKIRTLETLEPLKELKKLKSLDLFTCDITNEENYRVRIFELLPQLKFLDGFDEAEANCEEDSDEEGYDEDDDDEEDDPEVDDDDDEENEEADEEVDDEDDETGENGEAGDEEDEESEDNGRGKKRKIEETQ